MIEFKAKRARQLTLAALLAAGSGALHAIEVAALPEDLTELSLEDLMAVEVVSVSKKAEPLQIAAGAIYVISGEEIRRNGARSALPGLPPAAGVGGGGWTAAAFVSGAHKGRRNRRPALHYGGADPQRGPRLEARGRCGLGQRGVGGAASPSRER